MRILAISKRRLPWWIIEDAADSQRDGETVREQLGVELA
jgi:hypothetical protein